MRCSLVLFAVPAMLWAQEAGSGFELRTTVSGQAVYSHLLSSAPRNGSPADAGFRVLLYPAWKLNQHWTLSGAVQIHSRPYFLEQFTSQGYGVRADILQLHLGYTRVWRNNRSIVFRAGQLSSSFGSFLLRYDDADNSLIHMPLSYGYYYKPVSTYGLAGAQADVTLGKLDLRAQFANSSPANRRSIFDSDQYGSWSGGAGYTIRQGLRVGASGYRGPYLHRQHRFFFRGEANPKDLPASAYAVDVEWGRGHWTANGEWQRFILEYRAVPTLTRSIGYAEVRRVLGPRWYVAGRASYSRASQGADVDVYEFALGYRPGAHSLVKAGYQVQRGPAIQGTLGNTLAVQFVTTFRAISFGK